MISPKDENRVSWAPAALVQGDKIKFIKCAFYSIQDTLTDNTGRHYYESCIISGAVDFIWGYGQTIFKVIILTQNDPQILKLVWIIILTHQTLQLTNLLLEEVLRFQN